MANGLNILTNEVFQEEMGKLRAAIGGGDSSSGNDGGNSSGAFIIDVDANGSLDKTWNEIRAAFLGGKQCIVMLEDSNTTTDTTLLVSVSTQIVDGSADYTVTCFGRDGGVLFATSDRSGYPVFTGISPGTVNDGDSPNTN